MKKVSVVIVNHNGKDYLKTCLNSVYQTENKRHLAEVIVVDNCSTDDSVDFLKKSYSDVYLIRNNINNYVKAVNLGLNHASSDVIVLLNNDTFVNKNWVSELVNIMEQYPQAGVVQSKILFSDGQTLNSVGVEEIEHLYFRDSGFGEKDIGQYDSVKEIDFFSGGSVAIRRDCIKEVGFFDEDFIMFFEDIDYSIRCKKKGWKIYCAPKSVVHHKYHGTATSELSYYLCNRNRFLFIAKHYPSQLSSSIRTSHAYQNKDYSLLQSSLIEAAQVIISNHDKTIVQSTLSTLRDALLQIYESRHVYNFFSKLELMQGLRTTKIGIYDHAFHFSGGGQRYVAEMAKILQDKYDVTYIANKDVKLSQYMDWYNIDLSRCKLKIVKIPFFEKINEYTINESAVLFEDNNPFDIIGDESLNYDVFINANMLSKVKPQALYSIFVCHFPDNKRGRFFHVDDYNCIISNGSYTSSWIAKKWGLEPAHLLYPPVDMYNPVSNAGNKKNIILSVARFEVSGSKKQIEMAKAFANLARKDKVLMQSWTLVLAGGTFPGNPYFDKVKRLVESLHCNIELRPDVTYEELRALYRDAAIFWHACGLKEKDPHLVEHFGMTTVEAMQNFCVPVVIDGGGQREIVEHNVSGFRFRTVKQLQEHTKTLISDEVLRQTMAENAYNRSHNFNMDVFRAKLDEIFGDIEIELKGKPIGIQGLVGNAKQKG